MASCITVGNVYANRDTVDITNNMILPIEIWHSIFQYLDVADLCRCCQVCSQWNQLIGSNERIYWQRLYLQHRHGIHPNWPNDSDKDVVSWINAIKHNYLARHFWFKLNDENSLLSNIFRNRKRFSASPRLHLVTVGHDQDYDELSMALSSIPLHEYTRIMLYPGCYRCNLVTLKRTAPLEIIGHGNRADIIINMPLPQQGFNMRCENVTFKCDDGYNKRIEVNKT